MGNTCSISGRNGELILNFKWEILKKMGELGDVELNGWIMLKHITSLQKA